MDQHLNFGFTQNIMMCILLSCISVSPIAYMNNLSMLGFFFILVLLMQILLVMGLMAIFPNLYADGWWPKDPSIF